MIARVPAKSLLQGTSVLADLDRAPVSGRDAKRCSWIETGRESFHQGILIFEGGISVLNEIAFGPELGGRPLGIGKPDQLDVPVLVAHLEMTCCLEGTEMMAVERSRARRWVVKNRGDLADLWTQDR